MSAAEDIALDLRATPEINPLYLFRWEQTQESYVLLYPEGVVKLNDSAGEILKRCTGANSVEQVIAEVAALFDGSPEAVENGVRKFLEVSYAKGWIRVRA